MASIGIESSPSGDMAYEYGTLHVSSDSKIQPATGHDGFEAVMLIVYKVEGAVCEQVAETMQPLDEPETSAEEKQGHQ